MYPLNTTTTAPALAMTHPLEELCQTHDELLDSVWYAKRIQDAILPDRILFNAVFPESFLMFKARNTVSGDFYCYARLGNKVVTAVADCTGHGIPGAMVSIMGYTIIDDIVKCNGITDPSQVLSRLDNAVRKLFKQGRNGVGIDDGMDIAVCTIDFEERTIEFAGANRPLFHFHKGELNIIQGSKNSIGGRPNPNAAYFDSVKHPFESGDTIYMFTDGYTDQFGGEQNKKFRRKQFIGLLESIQHMNLDDQHAQIDIEHHCWKGTNAQTDDILVMGLKLP